MIQIRPFYLLLQVQLMIKSQVKMYAVRPSVQTLEDDVASVVDGLFDLEQDGEAETAPPVVISSDNAP